MKLLSKYRSGFTIVELTVVISVMAILAAIISFAAISIQKSSRDSGRDLKVQIISDALEKYYDRNKEYPSVALMTSQNVETLKQKLQITDSDVFKFPGAVTANSIVATNPTADQLVYAASITDSSKNYQCQTDSTGYCDGYQFQYRKEVDNTLVSKKSIRSTFVALNANGTPATTPTCNSGDTLNGTTCTNTYAATYNAGQMGSYSCPNGGTLSGTNCTYTASNSYSCPYGGTLSNGYCYTSLYGGEPAGGCGSDYTVNGGCYGDRYAATSTKTCPSGGTLSGNNCTYAATYSGTYYCPNGGTLSGTKCNYAATATPTCPSGGTLSGNYCYTDRYGGAPAQGCGSDYNVNGDCYGNRYAASSGYTCPYGGTLSNAYCYTSYYGGEPAQGCGSDFTINGGCYGDRYAATGYFSCPSGGTLSGSTCSYNASPASSSAYYSCPSGGTLSGTTCTRTYPATNK